MRRALPTIVCCLLARAGLAAEPPAAVALGEHAELLKLPKDNTPTTSLGRAFVRLSPTGRRLLYLRRHGGAGTIPHLVEVGRPKSDSPVPWEGQGIGVYYARLGMSGVVWRADGQNTGPACVAVAVAGDHSAPSHIASATMEVRRSASALACFALSATTIRAAAKSRASCSLMSNCEYM